MPSVYPQNCKICKFDHEFKIKHNLPNTKHGLPDLNLVRKADFILHVRNRVIDYANLQGRLTPILNLQNEIQLHCHRLNKTLNDASKEKGKLLYVYPIPKKKIKIITELRPIKAMKNSDQNISNSLCYRK